MASIGTGYHGKCERCGRPIKGARYALCKVCRESKTRSKDGAKEVMTMYHLVRRTDGAVYSTSKRGIGCGFGLGNIPIRMSRSVAEKWLAGLIIPRDAVEIREAK